MTIMSGDMASMFIAVSAGAVLVPLNTRFKGAEAAYIINRARAKVLFSVTDFLDTNYLALVDEAEPTPTIDTRVVLRGAPGPSSLTWDDFLAGAAGGADGPVPVATTLLADG